MVPSLFFIMPFIFTVSPSVLCQEKLFSFQKFANTLSSPINEFTDSMNHYSNSYIQAQMGSESQNLL